MIAALLVMAGGGAVLLLPRHVRVGICRVLRPAESALRRLVVVVKLVMAIEARYVPRGAPGVAGKVARESGARVPVFPLFDRRKHFDLIGKKRVTRGNPRLWSPGMDYPVFVTESVPLPDDEMSAERLNRRMLALQSALDDLPKQARRLALWQAKREAVVSERPSYPPIRPGRPPGYRARISHPVDSVLQDCHALALYALHDPPDTS